MRTLHCTLIVILFHVSQIMGQETPKPFAFTREFAVGTHRFVADFARVDVPENRDQTSGARVQIALCRLRSTATAPGDPLFYIPGAPDSASRLRDEDEWAGFWAAYLKHGDVVLMDQRGLGESQPQLSYESADWKPWLLYTNENTAKSHILQTATAAKREFAAKGVNASYYDVPANIDDIEAVRRAIGYKKIQLMGHSGGSHLALAYVRKYPEAVARLVSIGTAGPNDIMKPPSESDESLRQVAALMKKDSVIGKDFPDFEATMRQAMDELEKDPLRVDITDPRTNKTVQVSVGRFGLQFLLIQDLADETDLVKWPKLLKSIEKRDASLVKALLQKRVNGLSSLPIALFVSRAASGATKDRWAQIDREAPTSVFGRARMLFCPEIGTALGVRDSGDTFRASVQSQVTALFVSGSLDAHTPPQQAMQVRAGFPNSAHVILENAGHDTIVFDGEVRKQILGFLQGQKVTDQTIARPAIRFESPSI